MSFTLERDFFSMKIANHGSRERKNENVNVNVRGEKDLKMNPHEFVTMNLDEK